MISAKLKELAAELKKEEPVFEVKLKHQWLHKLFNTKKWKIKRMMDRYMLHEFNFKVECEPPYSSTLPFSDVYRRASKEYAANMGSIVLEALRDPDTTPNG